MRVLLAVTYYHPHLSGLTVYVRRLAEGLAANNIPVTVLTSQHRKDLPLEESLRGVRVVRLPVAFRVSKGVIAPALPGMAASLIRAHDVVAINLPCTPAEALLLPLLARRHRRPLTATYHCDVRLPAGLINRLGDLAVRIANSAAGRMADRIVAYTADYADRVPLLKRNRGKCRIIPPPVEAATADPERIAEFRKKHGGGHGPLIGFAARLAAEKGVEYMLRALPQVLQHYPHARVLFAGEHEQVLGERKYRERMKPALEAAGPHWHFLGVLPPEEMAVFYSASDVTVLPSINSTESFGLVQVESMLCGTPVVATDLPGVRVPVHTTGMGRIVPPADPGALADAVCDLIRDRAAYVRPRSLVEDHFSTTATVNAYLRLFQELLERKGQHV